MQGTVSPRRCKAQSPSLEQLTMRGRAWELPLQALRPPVLVEVSFVNFHSMYRRMHRCANARKSDTWGIATYIIKMFFIFKIMYFRVPFNSNLPEYNTFIYKNEIFMYTFKNISTVPIKTSILAPINSRKSSIWVILFNFYPLKQRSKPSIYLPQVSLCSR